MLVRNVGHHMLTDAVLRRDRRGSAGDHAGCGVHLADRDARPQGAPPNSRKGSVYIVKPKLHGPEEVANANALFGAVEKTAEAAREHAENGHHGRGAPHQRQSQSLYRRRASRASCSSIPASSTAPATRSTPRSKPAPIIRKAEIKNTPWIKAYEDRNVDFGLDCGLQGRAQIGKGMWAAPDQMAAMLEQKIAHPRAGANTAWVPSPTAATLHATALPRRRRRGPAERAEIPRRPRKLEDLLTIPLADRPNWNPAEVQQELDNNCQGMLGYVVRWVDQGVGCSKVPDIHDVGLMEDRATLRISSQHIANWLHHGIATKEQVTETLKRMAVVVDKQNAGDPAYTPMAPGFDGPGFRRGARSGVRGPQPAERLYRVRAHAPPPRGEGRLVKG